jgi:hypothetical protein
MDREKILRSYMRRRCDGSLAYPRTVYAHLEVFLMILKVSKQK